MIKASRSFVFVRRGEPPPSICFKCGAREGLSVSTFHFHTTPDEFTAEAAADAAGLIFDTVAEAAPIVELVRLIRGTREADVPIPLCAPCAARWEKAKRASRLGWLPVALAVLALLVAALAHKGPLLSTDATSKGIFIGVTAAVVYVLLVWIPALVRRKVVHPGTCGVVAIAPEWIALTRVHPLACEELMVRPG